MRRAALIVSAAIALLASGCATSVNGIWIGDESSPRTRDELYRRHGPPDAIRRTEGSTWLRYDFSAGKGVTLGARSTPNQLGAGLVLSRNQSASDRVWVEVAPDGRVVGFDTYRGTPKLRYRLWPFGR